MVYPYILRLLNCNIYDNNAWNFLELHIHSVNPRGGWYSICTFCIYFIFPIWPQSFCYGALYSGVLEVEYMCISPYMSKLGQMVRNHTIEKIVLRRRYIWHLYNISAIVFTILFAVKWANFLMFNTCTIISRISLFLHVIYTSTDLNL